MIEKKYTEKAVQPMLVWELEPGSLDGVTLPSPDYIPKKGDMVAYDPNDPSSRWIVTKEYLAANYDEVVPEYVQLLKDEHEELAIKHTNLRDFMQTEPFDLLVQQEIDDLRTQEECMDQYLSILEDRLARVGYTV